MEPAGVVVPLRPAAAQPVTFSRTELNQILNYYGRMVAAGEWRDYAIDFLRDRAVFSIFRRASERPLYRVLKVPALSARQGAYALVGADGRVLKRGHEIGRVLHALDAPLRLV